MSTLIYRLVLSDQQHSQVHHSNTQVLRHFKPVATFVLKPATSTCWEETRIFSLCVVHDWAALALSWCLGTAGALQPPEAVSVTGGRLCLCFSSCGQGEDCTQCFVCALMASALWEPGTGAMTNGLFLFPYAVGNTTKQPVLSRTCTPK